MRGNPISTATPKASAPDVVAINARIIAVAFAAFKERRLQTRRTILATLPAAEDFADDWDSSLTPGIAGKATPLPLTHIASANDFSNAIGCVRRRQE